MSVQPWIWLALILGGLAWVVFRVYQFKHDPNVTPEQFEAQRETGNQRAGAYLIVAGIALVVALAIWLPHHFATH